MKKSTRAVLTAGATAFAIVVGGLAGVGIAGALIPNQEIPYDGSVHSVERFPTNESGQTYGFIDQGLKSDPSARAQLIAVTTDEGVDGYAYHVELFPTSKATSPEEAVRMSTEEPYPVAVYAIDGASFIGFMTVNSP